MSAPTVIAKGTASATTTATCIPAHPANILANDIIYLLAISHQPVSVGQVNTPSGFTLVARGTYSNSASVLQGAAGLFWKRAIGGELGTVSVGRSGDTGADTQFFAQMVLVRGCAETGDPWDSFSARYGPGNATVTWDAVTVSGVERTLLAFCCQADDSPGVSTPTGYTRPVPITVTTSGTDAQLSIDSKVNVSSGPAVTAANGETLGWATFHVAAKPVASSIPETIIATKVNIGVTGQGSVINARERIATAVGSLLVSGQNANAANKTIIAAVRVAITVAGRLAAINARTAISALKASIAVVGRSSKVNQTIKALVAAIQVVGQFIALAGIASETVSTFVRNLGRLLYRPHARPVDDPHTEDQT